MSGALAAGNGEGYDRWMIDTVPPSSSACDVVVVGAGAAGVAAGRRLVEAGLDVIVIEARDRIGGRAHSVPTSLGAAVDVGCEWLHSAESNPWVDVARRMKFEIDETLPNWGARVSWLLGEAAQKDWAEAREAFDERCEQAAGGDEDVPESALLEPGSRWNALIGAISTWANGTELEHVSVKDHALYANSGYNWRLPRGYGTLISAYGATLPLRLQTIVERIDHSGKTITVGTNRGDISARAAIVTIPTNLLARETIRFTPRLPDKIAAAAGLPLGIANKLFLALDGPIGELPRDRHLIGALDRVATAGYQILPHGWPMIGAYFGGELAARLERRPGDMAAFAIDELAGLLGSDIRARLRPLAQSAWVQDPFANGSYSSALPGHAGDRKILMEPIDERLFFAGEACSIEFFGTAHAALISAQAAAKRIIARLVTHQQSQSRGRRILLD
jgi:monoamine oxidase